MNNKIIQYYRKDNYGNLHFYVFDAEKARWIQTLTRKKTIDSQDMAALEGLGFEMKEVIAPR